MQRFPAAVPAGIRFGDTVFSEPVPLARWWPPRGTGLYVVLVPDFTWLPRPFQPVYVGEYGQGCVRVTSDEYLSWYRVAAGRDLYVAAHEIPDARATQAPVLKEEIVRMYTPVCNRRWSEPAPADALARRLETIERRDLDQDALLKVLVAALSRVLTPPPEPAKKEYGFKPADRREPRESTASGK